MIIPTQSLVVIYFPNYNCFRNIKSDCDADGVSNANEFNDNTDPLDPCDLNPASIDRIPTAIKDCDEDGVADQTEILNGTDPNNACGHNIADRTMEVTSKGDCDGTVYPTMWR